MRRKNSVLQYMCLKVFIRIYVIDVYICLWTFYFLHEYMYTGIYTSYALPISYNNVPIQLFVYDCCRGQSHQSVDDVTIAGRTVGHTP